MSIRPQDEITFCDDDAGEATEREIAEYISAYGYRSTDRFGQPDLCAGNDKVRVCATQNPKSQQPIAIRPTANCHKANSQKLKAKSQKPKAKSQKPKAKSQKPKAESQKPKAESQKPNFKKPKSKIQNPKPNKESKQKVEQLCCWALLHWQYCGG